MEYKIPEPSKEPISALVVYYKILKSVEYDDRSWDKQHFGRSMKAAKELLEICKDYEQARRCIEELAQRFLEVDLSWSLETIAKHAHDWRQRRGKKNDIEIRARFFDALTRQRTKTSNLGEGEGVTGRQILGPLRDLEVFQADGGIQIRSGDSSDGEHGKRVQQG